MDVDVSTAQTQPCATATTEPSSVKRAAEANALSHRPTSLFRWSTALVTFHSLKISFQLPQAHGPSILQSPSSSPPPPCSCYQGDSKLMSVVEANENGFGHVGLLPAVEDDHGGVIVEMEEKDAMERGAFVTALRASLLLWKKQGMKGVWIKLPIGLVNLVEAAVQEGFWYHHAEPTYLMLVYWLPGTTNTIPENASHRVSVGAVVLKDKREILVVKEKTGQFQRADVWKIPTGVVDEGEDICDAAVREVKEETGIDAKFLEVLAFRQSHKSFFLKSDLFFLCILHPLTFDVQKQDLEIEAAQWMPFEEYATQPFAEKVEIFRYITDLCVAKVNRDYAGFSPRLTTSIFRNDLGYLYLNDRDLNQSKVQ